MTYGKVVGEALKVAPKQLRLNGRLIASPRGADYKAAGYLPVDSTNSCPEGYKWNDKWEVKDGKIIKKYDPIPQEELDILDGMAMVPMTREEQESYNNMEQTIAEAQAAAQEAQTAAETAQQEAAEALAAKEAAESALADYSEIIEKAEEVFG